MWNINCVIGGSWNSDMVWNCIFVSTQPPCLCVFLFVHFCYCSCFSHHSLDHSPAFIAFGHLKFTWGSGGVSLWLWALHCGNILMSVWPQLLFKPRPKLTAERGSWGCSQSESWVSEGILIQSSNRQNLCSVKTFVPFGSEQRQIGWSSAREGLMFAPLAKHFEKITTIIYDLYHFSKSFTFELRELLK